MSDWDRYSNEYDGRGTTYSDYGSSESEGMRGRARQSVEQVRSTAQQATGRAREGFDRYFHQHPLTFGLGALALGVVVGMLLPSTRPEERLMGDAAERMKERTREMAGKVGDVAKSSLQEARDTARSELEERGYDTGSLKESAQDMAQEARDVAEKSAKEARRAAEEEAKRNLR